MALRLPWRYLLVALVAAVLGGLVGFGVARVTDARRWPDLVFTSEKWKAVAQDERYVFWNDIDRRRLLVGKTRDEVVHMLGTPDSDAADRGRVTYVVKGAQGEYNMNFIYFLDIRFNDAGRVTTVSIGTD
jgi:hypothetical protein